MWEAALRAMGCIAPGGPSHRVKALRFWWEAALRAMRCIAPGGPSHRVKALRFWWEAALRAIGCIAPGGPSYRVKALRFLVGGRSEGDWMYRARRALPQGEGAALPSGRPLCGRCDISRPEGPPTGLKRCASWWEAALRAIGCIAPGGPSHRVKALRFLVGGRSAGDWMYRARRALLQGQGLSPRVAGPGASSSPLIIGVFLLCQPHSNMGAMVGMISVLSW